MCTPYVYYMFLLACSYVLLATTNQLLQYTYIPYILLLHKEKLEEVSKYCTTCSSTTTRNNWCVKVHNYLGIYITSRKSQTSTKLPKNQCKLRRKYIFHSACRKYIFKSYIKSCAKRSRQSLATVADYSISSRAWTGQMKNAKKYISLFRSACRKLIFKTYIKSCAGRSRHSLATVVDYSIS